VTNMLLPKIRRYLKRTRVVILYLTIATLIFLGIIYFFWVKPNQQLNLSKASLQAKDVLEIQNSIRTGLAQAIGGTVILLGLFFTWRNIQITERNLLISHKNMRATQDAAVRNLEVTQEGQITERFTKAIEHLGSSKLEIRLGGIYALERIANDSPKDHWQIIEVLTAYLRENSRWSGKSAKSLPSDFRTDLQAILTVLGRRARRDSEGDRQLDFSFTDLRSAYLSHGHFERASFTGAHLENAYADHVHLESAYFGGASLEGAELEWAHLEGAQFGDANLNANLMDAHLEGADLQWATGLTQEHLTLAFIDDKTKLPPKIDRSQVGQRG
jgi:hypothetical protein